MKIIKKLYNKIIKYWEIIIIMIIPMIVFCYQDYSYLEINSENNDFIPGKLEASNFPEEITEGIPIECYKEWEDYFLKQKKIEKEFICDFIYNKIMRENNIIEKTVIQYLNLEYIKEEISHEYYLILKKYLQNMTWTPTKLHMFLENYMYIKNNNELYTEWLKLLKDKTLIEKLNWFIECHEINIGVLKNIYNLSFNEFIENKETYLSLEYKDTKEDFAEYIWDVIVWKEYCSHWALKDVMILYYYHINAPYIPIKDLIYFYEKIPYDVKIPIDQYDLLIPSLKKIFVNPEECTRLQVFFLYHTIYRDIWDFDTYTNMWIYTIENKDYHFLLEATMWKITNEIPGWWSYKDIIKYYELQKISSLKK